ncbi:MAG: hypothetical protein ABI589_04785 [Burkholderiales bacterium]
MAIALFAWLALSPTGAAAATDLKPRSDSEVIERLPARVRGPSGTPADAAATARRFIAEARETAEPRYLGRAQAALSAWWDRADAPPELAVLQATIEQSRHEFAKARETLERTLARDPANAQGWLTLATLERVAARYDQALAACDRVALSGAAFFGEACRLETRSLLGFQNEARHGLAGLLRQAANDPVRAWLWSLAGENEERAGDAEAAVAAYRQALALDPDDYTALALADLRLRNGAASDALQALAGRPESDAVQLRRALALKQLGDPKWRDLAEDLKQRFEALAERGDDPALHAREAAQYSLFIEPDGAKAWAAAQANLRLQKEPLDWWLAFTSAAAAGDASGALSLAQSLHGTGLVDARLARWSK